MVAVQLAGNLEDIEFRDTDFRKIIFVLGAVGLLRRPRDIEIGFFIYL